MFSFQTGPEEASWPAQTLCSMLVASHGHWSVTFGLGDASGRLGPSLEQCLEARVMKGSWCVTRLSGWGLKVIPRDSQCQSQTLRILPSHRNLWNPGASFERPDLGTGQAMHGVNKTHLFQRTMRSLSLLCQALNPVALSFLIFYVWRERKRRRQCVLGGGGRSMRGGRESEGREGERERWKR